jgi:hypothetical protein
METQQMMELLLARFNTSMKEHNQDMEKATDNKSTIGDIEEMMAERKADLEGREAERKPYEKMMVEWKLTKKEGRLKESPTRR